MVTYITHDNGGGAFKVVIKGNKVTVYQNRNYCFQIIPQQIFIGKSNFDELTENSEAYGYKYNGNSILLKIADKKYRWIGYSVKDFETEHEIIEFSSPVGNNDVPYPYAIDNIGQVYLMIENVLLKHTPNRNPYRHYYENQNITPDLSRVPQLPVNIFEGIQQFYIGSRKYTFTYEPNPEENYKNIIKNHKKTSKIYIMVDNKKILLDEQNYVNIMKRYEKIHGFKALEMQTIIKRS